MALTKRHLYRVVLFLLLAMVIFTAACWFYAAQILNDFVRPHIEKTAEQLLSVEVQIGQMNWTDSGLELLTLQVSAPGRFQMTVPSTAVNFTLASLWNRQLDTLHLTAPIVDISGSKSSAKSAVKIPQQLPVTIKQLSVTDGQFRLVVAEQRLFFHNLEFSGSLQSKSDFRLSAFFGSDKKHPLAISGSAELLPQQVLTLTSLSWQKQQLLSSPLPIKLNGAALDFGNSRLQLDKLDHNNLREILNSLEQAPLLPEELQFILSDVSVGFSIENQALQLNLRVRTGQINWNEINATLADFKLMLNQLPNGWQLIGQLRGPAETDIELNAHWDDNFQLSGEAQLKSPAPDQLKVELFGGSALKIAGGLQLKMNYSLQNKHVQVTTEIQGRPADRQQNDDILNIGNVNGWAKFSRSDGKVDLSVALRLGAHPFFSVTGESDVLKVALELTDLPMFRQLVNAKYIPRQIEAFKGLKVKGTVFNKAKQLSADLKLTTSHISLPGLTLNRLIGQIKVQSTTRQVVVSESAFNVDLVRGDETSAHLYLQGQCSYDGQQLELQLDNLAVTTLNHISADEQTGVAEAMLKLNGRLSGPWPVGPIAVDLNGTSSIQEILAGDFYANLSAYQGDFSLAGSFDPDVNRFHIEAFQFDLPQIGSMSVNGHIHPQQVRLQLQLSISDLSEGYGDHIGPLLSETYPGLEGLTLEGQMALETTLLWSPDNWQSHGSLQPQGVDAFWQRHQLEMVDGTGTIPFVISSGIPFNAENSQQIQTGTISFRSLSAGLATLEQGQLQLSASSNRFSFRSPLVLQLAGGRVSIDNLNFSWTDGKPQGSVKINIDNVDLKTLTSELDLPVMQGNFSAELGTLQYANNRLTTDGLALIDVFGGSFQIRNMRYSEPFSRYPTFHSDIKFSGLDLLQATRTFDFGEMNGLLDGQIHGLELFGTTPSAFTAFVSTRKKGKRNISVKALNNLSILSQGGISSVLSRGIYRFIDFYRYRQIGFKCSLENDIFTLVGTALPGSNRYLVHGGLLPPRIDIISSTPTISFKEMLKRLKRIDRAGS